MRKLTWGDIALITVGLGFLLWAVRAIAAVLMTTGVEGLRNWGFWGAMACPLIAAVVFIFTGFRGRVDIKPGGETAENNQHYDEPRHDPH